MPPDGVELAVTTSLDREGCSVWVPGQPGGTSSEIDLTERQIRLLAYALLSRIPDAERRDYLDRLSAPVGPATLFAPLREVEIDDGHDLLAGERAVGEDHEAHAGVLHRDLVPDIRKRRGHGIASLLKKAISVATAAPLRTRLRHRRNRPALEARMARWTPPASLIRFDPDPPISTERALGNLNEARARLHRATHRPVAPDELRACRDTHRRALAAYTEACAREFGQ